MKTQEQFDREFYCEPDPRDRRLSELAKRYIAETEAFDRMVCTGEPRNGIAMPANGIERSIISRHAVKVRDRFLNEVTAMGLTRRDWQNALRHAE